MTVNISKASPVLKNYNCFSRGKITICLQTKDLFVLLENQLCHCYCKNMDYSY